eukprot:4301076-Prymnesium_polylepis.1
MVADAVLRLRRIVLYTAKAARHRCQPVGDGAISRRDRSRPVQKMLQDPRLRATFAGPADPERVPRGAERVSNPTTNTPNHSHSCPSCR